VLLEALAVLGVRLAWPVALVVRVDHRRPALAAASVVQEEGRHLAEGEAQGGQHLGEASAAQVVVEHRLVVAVDLGEGEALVAQVDQRLEVAEVQAAAVEQRIQHLVVVAVLGVGGRVHHHLEEEVGLVVQQRHRRRRHRRLHPAMRLFRLHHRLLLRLPTAAALVHHRHRLPMLLLPALLASPLSLLLMLPSLQSANLHAQSTQQA